MKKLDKSDFLNRKPLGFHKNAVVKVSNSDIFSETYLCYGKLYDESFAICIDCKEKVNCKGLCKK